MDPAIGALIGIGKSELVDRPNEARQRELQAVTAALSPWTKMQANPAAIKEANWQNAALQGAMAGAQSQQGGAQASPWSMMAAGGESQPAPAAAQPAPAQQQPPNSAMYRRKQAAMGTPYAGEANNGASFV